MLAGTGPATGLPCSSIRSSHMPGGAGSRCQAKSFDSRSSISDPRSGPPARSRAIADLTASAWGQLRETRSSGRPSRETAPQARPVAVEAVGDGRSVELAGDGDEFRSPGEFGELNQQRSPSEMVAGFAPLPGAARNRPPARPPDAATAQKLLEHVLALLQYRALKEALKIVRKIFPFYDTKVSVSSLATPKQRKGLRFNQAIGLYPHEGTTKREYARTIRHIRLFFEGKKKQLIRQIEKEMRAYQEKLNELEAANTQVLGVSIDTPFANHAFAHENGITFPILGDMSATAIVMCPEA
jgi:hypothetical protein